MTLTLPAPIRAYFDANTTLDTDAMLAPFSADAIVLDERRTHRGREAIRAWIEEASVGNQAVAVPQSLQLEDDVYRITARVEGAFPGSPVTLTFRFRLGEGRIAELEIV